MVKNADRIAGPRQCPACSSADVYSRVAARLEPVTFEVPDGWGDVFTRTVETSVGVDLVLGCRSCGYSEKRPL